MKNKFKLFIVFLQWKVLALIYLVGWNYFTKLPTVFMMGIFLLFIFSLIFYVPFLIKQTKNVYTLFNRINNI